MVTRVSLGNTHATKEMLQSSVYKSSTYQHPIQENCMYVLANKLKERTGPGQNHKVIGTLTKGEKVRVFKAVQSSSWLAIYYGSSYYWVSAKYLSEVNPE